MEEKTKRGITLNIYDTDIHVNVPVDQEEQYRLAGKLVNEKLNTYFNAYKGKRSDKEIICFAMIDIALKCVMESKRNDVTPYTDILNKLSSEIAEALK